MVAHLSPLTSHPGKNYYNSQDLNICVVKGSTISYEPQIIKRYGETAYLIDGLAVNGIDVVKFGIPQSDLIRRYERGQNSALAQLDGIVFPGLIMVEHIFRGLRRPLYNDGSFEADTQKLVHTWCPKYDFDWPEENKTGRPRRWPAVANSVFAVIINKNERHLEKWPEVYGWIDRWNWIYDDGYLPGAPMNWSTRYEERLFSRGGG